MTEQFWLGVRVGGEGPGIKVLRIPYRAPIASAICELSLGSVRRECPDHFLIFGEVYLCRVIKEYVAFFNAVRPHRGTEQQIPGKLLASREEKRAGKIIAFPVLNGLRHDFRRVG